MELAKSKRFLQEYNEFLSLCEKIEKPEVKSQLEKMIGELLFEVKDLDRRHEQIFIAKQGTDALSDKRDRIVSIRKKIHSKLQDCKRAGLIN